MKKYSSWGFRVIIIIGFVLLLYWLEGSNWSSQAVARHNGGYGTFDMKSYDAPIVKSVLASMDPEGYQVSYRYYIGDYLFIVFFGLLQYIMLQMVFGSGKSHSRLKRVTFFLSIVFLVLRGMTDIIENTILVGTLIRYPLINETMIGIASISTTTKLLSIQIWVFLLILGIVLNVILKDKKYAN